MYVADVPTNIVWKSILYHRVQIRGDEVRWTVTSPDYKGGTGLMYLFFCFWGIFLEAKKERVFYEVLKWRITSLPCASC